MLKQWLRHKTIQGVAVQGCTALFAFANIALLNRCISTELFGSFMLFLSIINVGEGMRSGYGQSFFQKVYHRKPHLRKPLQLLALRKSFILSLPIALLTLLAGIFLFKDPLVVVLLLLHYPLSAIQAYVLWMSFSNVNYLNIFLLRAIFYLGFMALVFLFAQSLDWQLPQLILAWSGLTLLSSLLIWLSTTKNYTYTELLKTSKTKALSRLFKRFGRFSAISSGFGILLRSSDPMMIGYMVGSTQVAWFAVPQRLMELPEILTRSIALNFAKNVANISDKKNRKRVLALGLKESLKGMLLLSVAAMALAVFGSWLLKLLAPDFYGISYGILLFMLPYLLFLVADRISGVLLDFFGHPQYNTFKVVTMLVVNIVGNALVLYFLNDIKWVALVSSLTFGIGVALGWFRLRKIVMQHG